MNDKINRGQLVRTYIGEGLAPFKFEYKGYQGDSWKFERNMKGAVQTISIYPYRFDQSMITFELYTNVKNSEYASKIGTNVVSASMLDGIVSNGQIRGYWQYGNEQELIQVLGEMKDVLTEVTVMDEEGEIVTLPADKLELGYRTSIIKTAGYIVLEAKLQLKEGNPEVIRETMKDLTIRRTTKQPLEYPSAGSTFKRPEGYFAGKLIMDSGLAGYQVGGAQVSEKHCGFVINAGGATARDVRTLMDNVRDIVYKKYGVTLEPEVKFLGDFEA